MCVCVCVLKNETKARPDDVCVCVCVCACVCVCVCVWLLMACHVMGENADARKLRCACGSGGRAAAQCQLIFQALVWTLLEGALCIRHNHNHTQGGAYLRREAWALRGGSCLGGGGGGSAIRLTASPAAMWEMLMPRSTA